MTNPVDLGLARWVADHRAAPVTDMCRSLEDLGRSPLFFGVVALAVLVVVAVRREWGALGRVATAGF
ncbi:MAG: hypothetical protein JWQ91_3170, partial [Aeromicrobium sp.]|uniref:hypothetical protein n=1 Tax=Aeromicrobium sp. TaxID=1871063 RepID=UPI00262AAFEE